MAIVRKRKTKEIENNTKIDSFYKPISKENNKKRVAVVDENASNENERPSPSPPSSQQSLKGGLKVLGDSSNKRTFGDKLGKSNNNNKAALKAKTFGEQKQSMSKPVRQPLGEKILKTSTNTLKIHSLFKSSGPEFEVLRDKDDHSEKEEENRFSTQNIFESNTLDTQYTDITSSPLDIFSERAKEAKNRNNLSKEQQYTEEGSQSSQLVYNDSQNSNADLPFVVYNDQESRQSSPLVVYKDNDSRQSSPFAVCKDNDSRQSSPLVIFKDNDSRQSSPLEVYSDEVDQKDSPLVVYKDENSQRESPIAVYKDSQENNKSPLDEDDDDEFPPITDSDNEEEEVLRKNVTFKDSPLIIYHEEETRDSQALFVLEDNEPLTIYNDNENEESISVFKDVPTEIEVYKDDKENTHEKKSDLPTKNALKPRSFLDNMKLKEKDHENFFCDNNDILRGSTATSSKDFFDDNEDLYGTTSTSTNDFFDEEDKEDECDPTVTTFHIENDVFSVSLGPNNNCPPTTKESKAPLPRPLPVPGSKTFFKKYGSKN